MKPERTSIARACGLALLLSLLASPASATVRIVWGDANGFTLDGVALADALGPATVLVQLVQTSSALPQPPHPAAPDGIGPGELLLDSVLLTLDPANPPAIFLESHTSPGPPAPGSFVYARIFDGASVSVGARYAATIPVSPLDLLDPAPPQLVTWTGAPPGMNVGNPPQELAGVVTAAATPTLAPLAIGLVIAGLLTAGAVAASRVDRTG